MVALAAGLTLLACGGSKDEIGDSISDTSSQTGTLGDGDGDTQESAENSGADYGGPIPEPCDLLETATVLSVGSNPVDTSAAPITYETSCDTLIGSGPELLLSFTAPAAATYSFALSNATTDAWVIEFDSFYCQPYGGIGCVPNQALSIEMSEGSRRFLLLDGTAAGTATIDVTQN